MRAVTEIYHNGRTYEEHCAWLNSLEHDEWLIVYTPIGHLFSLAMVSFFKRALLEFEMSAGERLNMLDAIAGMIHGVLTAEAVAAVQPCCKIAAKMIYEIMRAPIERQTMIFADADLFRKLAQINPSLITALELCHHYGQIPPKRSAQHA